MAIWDNFTNQNQWESYLKNLIRTNEKALLKSIVTIYDSQTAEEKEFDVSLSNNKMGFNKWDVEEMSGIAKKIKSGQNLEPNEIYHANLIMPKYWRQLMIVSKRNIQEKKELDEAFAEMQNANKSKTEFLEEMKESIRMCVEENKSCSYGICDECPLANRYI